MAKPLQWAVDRAAVICAALGVDWQEFVSKGRDPDVVEARTIAAYILRHYCGPTGERASFPEIAVSIGRNETAHTTIMTALNRADDDHELRAKAQAIALSMRWVPWMPPFQPPVSVPLHAVAAMRTLVEWVQHGGMSAAHAKELAGATEDMLDKAQYGRRKRTDKKRTPADIATAPHHAA